MAPTPIPASTSLILDVVQLFALWCLLIIDTADPIIKMEKTTISKLCFSSVKVVDLKIISGIEGKIYLLVNNKIMSEGRPNNNAGVGFKFPE